MPTWMIPLVMKFLSQVITPAAIKGAEKDLFDILEKSVAGHPLAEQILKLVEEALGLK